MMDKEQLVAAASFEDHLEEGRALGNLELGNFVSNPLGDGVIRWHAGSAGEQLVDFVGVNVCSVCDYIPD